jgi:hypothetical protein
VPVALPEPGAVSTVIVQNAPGASEDPQLFVCDQLPDPEPPMLML